MPQSPSLKGLADKFLTYIVSARGFSPNTQESYRRAIDQFRFYLSEMGEQDLLSSFTEANVQGFVTWLADRRVTPGTIVTKLTAVSSLADHLMKARDTKNRPYLATNPTKSFHWPTVEAPETHFLHPDEVRAFMAVELPLHEEAARELMFDTGVRVSEACRANVGDLVEFEGGWALTVTVKGKGTRRRKVHMPLDGKTAELLRGFLLQRGFPTSRPDLDAEKPLLVNSNGDRYSRCTLARVTERIAKAAGITRFHMSPHKLRHTANVIRDQAGINEYLRSRLLGQSSVRSQERYRHLISGDLREAKDKQAEGLARYLGERHTS